MTREDAGTSTTAPGVRVSVNVMARVGVKVRVRVISLIIFHRDNSAC